MHHLAKVLVAGAISAAMLVTPIDTSRAQVAGGAVQFRPHRAVYDITFDHATPGSGVADMSGRMVYEMTGSSCGEYAQNMRFVTRMTNQEGVAQVNDLRTSSFEDLTTHRLRFSSSQYENQKLSEASQGSAGPGNGASFTEVKLVKPAKKTVKLPSDIYFPIQHSLALVEAARAGHSQFTANLYDGSDKGEKFYETSAVIGPRAAPGSVKVAAKVANGDKLDGLSSWPIAIGYFEPGPSRLDALPTYELSFRFYENGVSSRLYIDYGDFAIRGELKELTFLEEGKCAASPSPAPVKR
ncbi:MAG: cell envelope integrity EipB family protein [Hyphomicrobium sp.]|uniref:cell envelope integrity EipB family protein n=1 Tax=Hyphomicrobium sp. TaxID=82 RepID=UPI0025BC64EB|nr:cell envelope integrity EipB family protein [Hyphomicrobium sp.]MBZ0211401.1 cell envelope integrity EipB family protein [Hyphomicrobium sp.]